MNITTKRPLAALLVSVLLLALTILSVPAPSVAAAPAPAGGSGFFSGRLIDPATGDPVEGVTVKVFRINDGPLLGRAKSGPNGRFRVNGLPAADEELEVRVRGTAVDYESGWFSCAHTVVPSWGDACSLGQGAQGRFRIQHL